MYTREEIVVELHDDYFTPDTITIRLGDKLLPLIKPQEKYRKDSQYGEVYFPRGKYT